MTATSLDTEIRKHRTCDVTLTITRADGSRCANVPVTVAQTRHKFLFGGNGHVAIPFASNELDGAKSESAATLLADQLEIFNAFTLPFYWGRFEPVRGEPDTGRVMSGAKWLVERGVKVKGHPLVWHTVSADWLLQLPDDEIIEAQLARVRRDVRDFAGVIDMWDVINEVVIMPVFDKYDNGVTRMAKKLGRVGIVDVSFDAARDANPKTTLLLNDFDMSSDYERLIEGCLSANVKIDVIGLQSHMHQGWWGVEKTLDVLNRFSRFGLPLHFTETNIISGKIMPPEIVDLNDYQVSEWPTTPEGEARQADEAAMHYKLLLAHPSVQSITWWDFQDGGWLKAPVGLVREDGSTKPAYDALRKLINGDWWLKPTTIKTDANGVARLTGFRGDYEVRCDDARRGFTVDGSAAVQVTL